MKIFFEIYSYIMLCMVFVSGSMAASALRKGQNPTKYIIGASSLILVLVMLPLMSTTFKIPAIHTFSAIKAFVYGMLCLLAPMILIGIKMLLSSKNPPLVILPPQN